MWSGASGEEDESGKPDVESATSPAGALEDVAEDEAVVHVSHGAGQTLNTWPPLPGTHGPCACVGSWKCPGRQHGVASCSNLPRLSRRVPSEGLSVRACSAMIRSSRGFKKIGSLHGFGLSSFNSMRLLNPFMFIRGRPGYVVLPGGACAPGSEVPQEECESAGRSVRPGWVIPSTTEFMTRCWPQYPQGCIIRIVNPPKQGITLFNTCKDGPVTGDLSTPARHDYASICKKGGLIS